MRSKVSDIKCTGLGRRGMGHSGDIRRALRDAGLWLNGACQVTMQDIGRDCRLGRRAQCTHCRLSHARPLGLSYEPLATPRPLAQCEY